MNKVDRIVNAWAVSLLNRWAKQHKQRAQAIEIENEDGLMYKFSDEELIDPLFGVRLLIGGFIMAIGRRCPPHPRTYETR